MYIEPTMRLEELLDEQPELLGYLDWRGIEFEAWEATETLGALCERWEVEWEEWLDEFLGWLESEEEREIVEWHEELSPEE